MDKQAEIIIRQYQQWLAESQLECARLSSENILLKEQLKPKDPNVPEASSGLVE